MKNIKFLFIGVFCLLLIGCTNVKKESKTVASSSNFESAASNNGLTVTDNMTSYSDVDYITEAKIATLDNITIEMITYKDVDSANKVQETQIKSFKNIKNTATTENKEKGENYYRFWMISNGYYMISVRVENTLVFCKTPLTNKEKVEAILNEMNY